MSIGETRGHSASFHGIDASSTSSSNLTAETSAGQLALLMRIPRQSPAAAIIADAAECSVSRLDRAAVSPASRRLADRRSTVSEVFYDPDAQTSSSVLTDHNQEAPLPGDDAPLVTQPLGSDALLRMDPRHLHRMRKDFWEATPPYAIAALGSERLFGRMDGFGLIRFLMDRSRKLQSASPLAAVFHHRGHEILAAMDSAELRKTSAVWLNRLDANARKGLTAETINQMKPRTFGLIIRDRSEGGTLSLHTAAGLSRDVVQGLNARVYFDLCARFFAVSPADCAANGNSLEGEAAEAALEEFRAKRRGDG